MLLGRLKTGIFGFLPQICPPPLWVTLVQKNWVSLFNFTANLQLCIWIDIFCPSGKAEMKSVLLTGWVQKPDTDRDHVVPLAHLILTCQKNYKNVAQQSEMVVARY